ncbi:MAG: hypothetical protein OEZ54_10970, partial [Gemmatimonadota bacterium]|nr:hypothetical protein [Gemmatimonadota bacterium]
MTPHTLFSAKLPLVLAISTMIVACGPTAAGDDGTPRPRRGGRNLILAEELTGAGWSNTYDAVRSLRPTWLRPRSSGTPQNPAGPPTVFVNDVRRGDIQALQSIS